MRKFVIICCCIFPLTAINAQKYLSVIQQGDYDKPFYVIQQKVNAFFDTATGENRGGYKRWKRFEWDAIQDLDESGMLKNRNQQSINAINKINISQKANSELITNAFWESIGHTNVVFNPSNNYQNISQGRINCISFHPTDPNTIFVGTSNGGVWKSINNGTNWTNISNTLSDLRISAIVIHPANPSIIYVTTGGSSSGTIPDITYQDSNDIRTRFFVTTNGGIQWDEIKPTPASGVNLNTVTNTAKLHPSNPDILFICTNIGLYRLKISTKDIQKLVLYTSDPHKVFDIEFKPNDFSTIYIGCKKGPGFSFYSYGFQKITLTANFLTSTCIIPNTFPSNQTTIGRMEIAVSDAEPESVWALCGDVPFVENGVNKLNGLLKSTDAGVNFTKIYDQTDVFFDQGSNNGAFAVNPFTPNQIVIAAVALNYSNNAGTSFNSVPGVEYIHADIHCLEFNKLNNNLYSGSDGGISFSNNFGESWTKIGAGIVNSEYYKIAVTEQDPNLYSGGCQDLGSLKRIGVTSETKLLAGADGMESIIDHSNSNIIYSCYQNGGMNKTTDGGNSSFQLTQPEAGIWVTPLVMDPANSQQLWFGGLSKLWVSNNGGNSWTEKFNADELIYKIKVQHNTANTNQYPMIMHSKQVGSQNKLWGSTNIGSINLSALNLPADIQNSVTYFISDVAINPDPTKYNECYLTLSNGGINKKVYKSVDFGQSWINVSLNLPNIPVYCIVYANKNSSPNDAVYIGTSIGVFYKDATLNGWTPFFNGLPYVKVTELEMNYTTNQLWAATFGRGIWRTDGYSACTPSLSLNGVYQGQQAYEASQTITSAATISGGTGTSVLFKAGDSITLTPGFSGAAGNIFRGVIAPCGTGLIIAQPVLATPQKKKINKK